MKYIFTVVVVFLVFYSMVSAKEIELTLGTGYENDIWFDLENGVVQTAEKDNWDLAFQTGSKDAGIRINSQKGMELWVVKESDGNTWNEVVDTSGMSDSWERCHNSTETWAIGAFNLGMDGFNNGGDFGWGNYNMATHSVTGSKVFVLILADGTAKKIMIESLLSGIYTVKWADLDGANEQSKEVNKSDYSSKMFVYLDISSSEVIDREPASDSWGLLFGKYTAMISMGETSVPYAVTGVRTNTGCFTAEVTGIDADLSTAPDYIVDNYVSNIDVIGSDWKSLNHETFEYDIVDKLSYFLSVDEIGSLNALIYKIVFKEFDGSSTGRLVFELTGGANSIDEFHVPGSEINISPNIVSAGSALTINNSLIGENINSIVMYSLTGELIAERNYNQPGASGEFIFDVPQCSSGLYFMSFRSDKGMYTKKVIIQ